MSNCDIPEGKIEAAVGQTRMFHLHLTVTNTVSASTIICRTLKSSIKRLIILRLTCHQDRALH